MSTNKPTRIGDTDDMGRSRQWHRVYCAVCGGTGLSFEYTDKPPRACDGRREAICQRCTNIARNLTEPVTFTGLFSGETINAKIQRKSNRR